MLINDLKELRAYSNQFGCVTRRADKEVLKVVQMVDAYGCVWRSGKGETAKEAWQDLCSKVFNSNSHPRIRKAPSK